MVIDVCTYNGEEDLWDLHFNALKDVVDEFIVIQFDETFSGETKPWYKLPGKYPRVKWLLYTKEKYEKHLEMAEASPNTAGAEHWKREFMQKESIKDALIHLKDDDTVFIGDVDEIWDPELAKMTPPWPVKLKLRVYTYFLNNRSSESFWGTLMARYGDIKDKCLNHIRTNAQKTEGYGGWHFTSMGGAVSLAKKLTDSYTQESYATSEVLENLAYNIENGKDFLGRAFTFKEDESEWPQYLKDNRETYAHLCK